MKRNGMLLSIGLMLWFIGHCKAQSIEVAQKDSVYSKVDVLPEFPGGMKALGKYIDGKNHFLKGFCFHPESAQKFILSQIKIYKANPDLQIKDFLLRLNKMRYKFEQYRHVKIEMIYNDDNKLGL